MSIIWTSLTLG